MNKAQGGMSQRLISKRKKKERTCKHRKEWKVKEKGMIKNAQALSKVQKKGSHKESYLVPPQVK